MLNASFFPGTHAGFKAYNYSKNEWKPFVTDALLQQVVIYNKHKINIYL